MSDNILQKFRVVKWDAANGTTLSRASIGGLTPERFSGMGRNELAVMKAYEDAAEARLVGYKPHSLDVLLFSSVGKLKQTPGTKNVDRFSANLPYVLRKQESQYHYDYFRILSGLATPGAGTGGIHTGSWDIIVSVNDDALYGNRVVDIHRAFVPGNYLFVDSADMAGDGSARGTAHKIMASVAVAEQPGQAKVTVKPLFTETGWGELTSGQKAVQQPTFGVLHLGTNSVNDEEAWCGQLPSDLPKHTLIDYLQVSRYTFKYNKEYDDTMKRIQGGEVNTYLEAFRSIPLAEQNRQAYAHHQAQWRNSIFFGQPINELQSPEHYASASIDDDEDALVRDPENGAILTYKANALGLRTLLINAGQRTDLKGAPLSLDLLFNLCYNVKKNREVGGSGEVEMVDLMTDRHTADGIGRVLIRFLKDQYGTEIRQNFEQGKVMDEQGAIHFTYNRYHIPQFQVCIGVFVQNYFTDRVGAFPRGTGGTQGSQDLRSRGASIWAIEWPDFNIAMAGANSNKVENKGKVWQSANKDYACIITPNTEWVDMRSRTWTGQLGDTARHFMIENYNPFVEPVIDGFNDGSA
jgi:hypothetical protein